MGSEIVMAVLLGLVIASNIILWVVVLENESNVKNRIKWVRDLEDTRHNVVSSLLDLFVSLNGRLIKVEKESPHYRRLLEQRVDTLENEIDVLMDEINELKKPKTKKHKPF